MLKKIAFIISTLTVLFFLNLAGIYRLNILSDQPIVINYGMTLDKTFDNLLGVFNQLGGGNGKYQYLPQRISISEINTNTGKFVYQLPITLIDVNIPGKRLLVKSPNNEQFYIKPSSWNDLDSSVTVFSWGQSTAWEPTKFFVVNNSTGRKLQKLICNQDLMTIYWPSDYPKNYWADLWGNFRPEHAAEMINLGLNLYTGVHNPILKKNEPCT